MPSSLCTIHLDPVPCLIMLEKDEQVKMKTKSYIFAEDCSADRVKEGGLPNLTCSFTQVKLEYDNGCSFRCIEPFLSVCV